MPRRNGGNATTTEATCAAASRDGPKPDERRGTLAPDKLAKSHDLGEGRARVECRRGVESRSTRSEPHRRGEPERRRPVMRPLPGAKSRMRNAEAARPNQTGHTGVMTRRTAGKSTPRGNATVAGSAAPDEKRRRQRQRRRRARRVERLTSRDPRAGRPHMRATRATTSKPCGLPGRRTY